MKDLTGQRFGNLTAIRYVGDIKSGKYVRHLWECQCDCGNIDIVRDNNLITGTVKSCGCQKKENISKATTKHGFAKPNKEERLYRIWKGMKRRCNSKNDKRYDRYGGRGIKVCEEWDNDYVAFRNWAYANGYDDTAPQGECTIDRIDNDGDYCPENCRWADKLTQMNNTSKNRYIEFNGEKMTISQFARVMNISPSHAWYYIDKYEKEQKHG
jgi:hypothetical protein